MIIENFKLEANKKNIYTATDLHKCMLREIGPMIPKYQTILNLWNGEESAKIKTLMLACHAIGLSSIKFK